MADDDSLDALLATFDEYSVGEFIAMCEETFPTLDIIGLPPLEPDFNHQVNGGFGEVNNDSKFCDQTNVFPGETSGAKEFPQERGEFFAGFGNPVEIPVYPVPPVPYSCTCCQVLREITHSNGNHFTKLELHGRLGIISHAILESRYTDPFSATPEYQMFDFCKKSLEVVRDMLVQYCEDRKQEGYTMLQDPLHTYYEAVCVGMNNGDNPDDFLNNFEDIFQISPLHSSYHGPGDLQIIQTQPVSQVEPQIVATNPPPKRSLSLQRKRTRKLTLRDFAGYNSFPIEQAAKNMSVCPTVLKKICRRHGLPRWPYRTIKSLRRQISEKKESLSTASGQEGKTRIEAELQPLEKELAAILKKFYHS